MAARRKMRRRARRARPTVRRTPSSSAIVARMDAKRNLSGDSGLMIGGVHDRAEKVADEMADRVMRKPAASSTVHRKCAACEGQDEKVQRVPKEAGDDETVQAKSAKNATPVAAGTAAAAASPSATTAIRSLGPGKPLGRAERSFFEPRFGVDLSSVRFHDDRQADTATRAIGARAFTLGTDIAFAKNEYRPHTDTGRQLMAHELAHVAVGDKAVRRKEDVCPKADAASHRSRFAAEVAAAHAAGDENRAVRAIKKILRCDPNADDSYVSSVIAGPYGTKKTKQLIKASKTALGGHVGFYPRYAGDVKTRLKELGVTDTEAHKSFRTTESGRRHRKRAARVAKGAEAKLERADILYFRGHQFAQYRAPGMFSDGAEERGVDLRYLQRAGGFPNVKLMISTSCAILCNAALSVFRSLFPNATIFGYGKSAPLHGSQVRREFGKQVRALKSPLLLESASDVSKLTGAWKATLEKRHPKERDAKRVGPGFFNGSKLLYWSGKGWVDGEAGKPINKCKRKGNFSSHYPPPT